MEKSGAERRQAVARAARLFDLRRVIGGLFLLYGVVLTIVGLVDSESAKQRAAGIDINLWTGLGMLALGALFAAWALARPLRPELESEEDLESGGQRR